MYGKVKFPVLLLVLAICLLVAVGGCSKSSTSAAKTDPTAGSSGKGVSGSDLVSSAKSSQSAIEAGKSSGKTTTTPPQTVPTGKNVDGTNVAPPQPQGDSYLVWDFSGIDFDGDDVGEAGVAMLDSTNTLYVWWSDYYWDTDDEVDGFLWIADQSAGFVLVLDDAVGLACAEAADGNEADAGCIACDDEGDCEVIAYSEVWAGGD